MNYQYAIDLVEEALIVIREADSGAQYISREKFNRFQEVYRQLYEECQTLENNLITRFQ